MTTSTYDLAGRTLSTSDTSGHTLAYAYDTAGRVTSNAITMPGLSGARTIAYAYDAAGNRTRVTWPDAFPNSYYVDYAYDALSRMVSASENGTTTLATYSYDRLSRRVGLTYGNGASVAYGRSWAGDLLSLVHAWGSDPNNLGGGSGVTFTHVYAPDHRLASTSISSPAFEWKPGTGGATALGTDAFAPANLLNQMMQVTLAGSTAQAITWDAAGNMTSDGTLTYVHDAENRLTSVTRTTPSLAAAYSYDPLGRRVQRNVNGTSTFTLHDGDEEIAEYDATGALIRRFIPGPGTDEPIAIVVPASGGGAPERRYFHEDRIGNVIAMSGVVSGGGAPALAEGPFTYDAYGRSPQPLGTSAASTPFRYTGRRLDDETGNYYYRARFYTPTLGQFIETDPVGYADSLNLYAYVGGDPVNSVDPSGAYVCAKQTGSRICDVAMREQKRAATEVADAITRLRNAIAAIRSGSIDGDAQGTIDDFSEFLGNHSDMASAMEATADRLEGVHSALTDMSGARQMWPEKMPRSTGGKTAVPGDGFRFAIWAFDDNNPDTASSLTRQMILIHEAFHEVLDVMDVRVPNADGNPTRVMRENSGMTSVRTLARSDPDGAVTNPDNLVCFIYSGQGC